MVMHLAAELPIADGGPTGPAWAFFTAIVVMLGGVIVEGIRRFGRVDHKLDEAKTVAEKAVDNTRSVSNGFAGGVNSKLDRLIDAVDKLERNHLEHLQWHLERDRNAHQ